MFEGLRNKPQGVIDEDYRRDYNYNESVETSEDNNKNNSGYQICIKVKDGDEYYVDDCDTNWLVLRGLEYDKSCFIYLTDSSEREGGILGIRVSEIVAFFQEEDD